MSRRWQKRTNYLSHSLSLSLSLSLSVSLSLFLSLTRSETLGSVWVQQVTDYTSLKIDRGGQPNSRQNEPQGEVPDL